jgi:hypothetical protein
MKKAFIILGIATFAIFIVGPKVQPKVLAEQPVLSASGVRAGSPGVATGPTIEYSTLNPAEQKPAVREDVIEKPYIPQQVFPVTPIQEQIADVVSTFSPSMYWKSRADGLYSQIQATEDFKNVVTGWNQSRMQISGGKLRTTLLKNTVGPEGGLVSWIDVPDADEYQLQFDMMFDNNFDFSQGGKVGFGLLIGDGNTGGAPAWSGNGGSVRLMWYKNTSNSPVILKPYVYYKDQPGQYGDDFGRAYPNNGSSISKGTWHTVKMYVKSNTSNNTDGYIQMSVDGVTLLDQPIRFTSNNSKRLVNRITFETFRGGADSSWQSSTDGQIYFDNVSWTAL